MKDPRYKAIKSLIESNNLKSLQEAFEIIPITVVKVDMNVNYNTLRNRINSPGLLNLNDMLKLAELFEVDSTLIFKLAIADLKTNISRKKN